MLDLKCLERQALEGAYMGFTGKVIYSIKNMIFHLEKDGDQELDLKSVRMNHWKL